MQDLISGVSYTPQSFLRFPVWDLNKKEGQLGSCWAVGEGEVVIQAQLFWVAEKEEGRWQTEIGESTAQEGFTWREVD